MRTFNFKSGLILFCVAVVSAISLVACASNPATANCPDNERVIQSFSFSMRESPDIEILDYFYGTPNCPSISNPDQYKNRGKSLQSESSHGPLRRYQKLYVKWRIKNTGQEFEDTVDLRNKLPKNMTNHEVHFTINGTQLYVYLITPERRPPDMPPNGPKATQFLKTITIYPDQTK